MDRRRDVFYIAYACLDGEKTDGAREGTCDKSGRFKRTKRSWWKREREREFDECTIYNTSAVDNR